MSISSYSVDALDVRAPGRTLLFGQKGYSLCMHREGKSMSDFFGRLSAMNEIHLRSRDRKEVYCTYLPEEGDPIPLPILRMLLLGYRLSESREINWIDNDLVALERAIRKAEKVENTKEVIGNLFGSAFAFPISLFWIGDIVKDVSPLTRLPRKRDLQILLGPTYKIV